MKYSISLNDLYADYLAGLLEKKKLEEAIFKVIQENIHYLCLPGWSKEDCDDYISWLYLRIRHSIGNYRNIGSTFEAYIGTMIKMSTKEYQSYHVRNYLKESAAWITHFPDMYEMYACENGAEYGEHIIIETKKTKNPVKLKNPRQILILILKCSHHIPADFPEKIAPSLGIELESLNKMINHLKHKMEDRETRIELLREKANRQLYRCILCQQNLRNVELNTVTALRLQKRLEQGRSKLIKMRKQIAHSRLAPSNSQIAETLGISKGTVDSVLYNLKTQWKNAPVSYANDSESKN